MMTMNNKITTTKPHNTALLLYYTKRCKKYLHLAPGLNVISDIL